MNIKVTLNGFEVVETDRIVKFEFGKHSLLEFSEYTGIEVSELVAAMEYSKCGQIAHFGVNGIFLYGKDVA